MAGLGPGRILPRVLDRPASATVRARLARALQRARPVLGRARPVLRRARPVLRRVATTVGTPSRRASPGFEALSPEDAVTIAYTMLLRRRPDPGGAAHFVGQLRSGAITRRQMVEVMLSSTEFRQQPFEDLNSSMHLSRAIFVKSLPRARRILDLGGTDQADERGALLSLGYPYPFERLVVVDLPPDDRHPLYRGGAFHHADTALGPVHYAYHSMTDLAAYEEGSFDLVYSGQSIEHVSVEEGARVLAQVHRVLRPGGWFCLDTPNGPAWRLWTPELINPDHKVEYGQGELSAALSSAGFEIVQSKGLNYAGAGVAEGKLSLAEASANIGMFDDVESCLQLAYVCRKPSAP
jgi:SAM-dependent methyltransferase